MFSTVDSLGGFDLAEIAFLYGATGLGLGIADLFVGRDRAARPDDPDWAGSTR